MNNFLPSFIASALFGHHEPTSKIDSQPPAEPGGGVAPLRVAPGGGPLAPKTSCDRHGTAGASSRPRPLGTSPRSRDFYIRPPTYCTRNHISALKWRRVLPGADRDQ